MHITNKDTKQPTTVSPHMAGLTTKTLVITGPIRRQAIIELEPAIKGLVAL